MSEKNIYLRRFLSVTFGLSDAEIEVFLILNQLNKKVDVAELSKHVRLSKSRISLILKKLSDVELVSKEKIPSEKGGRPKFLYYVDRASVSKLLSARGFEVCQDLQEIIASTFKV